MAVLTDSFNNVTAPLISLCQNVPAGNLGGIPNVSTLAQKTNLTELKAAADALSAKLAAQIATLP